jgi:hypothetical protein
MSDENEAEHATIHSNPLGEVVCSCGEMFEARTPRTVWGPHFTAARPATDPAEVRR